VNPHAQATNAWLEWGTDNALASPTVTAAQAIGAGTTDQSVGATITGLTLGTTYYYRIAATNASGTQKGTIASFTTALPNSPPSLTTDAATSVTVSGAVLNGTVSPNELDTTAVFEWGTDSNPATFTSTPSQSLGAGTTSVAITASLSGLTPGVTYYFRVAATNTAGTSNGQILSFSTAAQAPTVSTAAATEITTSGATLNGTVNPNGLATDAYFEYGTDNALASPNTSSTQAMGSGGTNQPINVKVSGLVPGTTYYFRVVATNAEGTSKGTILGFPTPVSPTVTTNLPTSITTSSAIFNGNVNPNGLSTTAWFEYGADPSLSSWTSTAGQAMGSGASPLSYSRSISGLSPYTTYYFRAAASNSSGTQKGVINSFLTGETYVAVGDSITRGSHDDIPGDGIGYEPILGNLLGVMIANAGVSGDSSADGAAAIDNTLAAYPSADYYLILYGSNDASLPVPKAAYKANMQTIIDKIKAAGKTPFLAKVPYATVPGFNDASIQEYNAAIDELKIANGLPVIPPDFYAWFNSRPDQLADGLHPDGTGYQSMANLWFNALP
jgi:lysophospholipase L1-like esterase